MAVMLGGRLVHVSIEPPDDEGPLRTGESIVQWPRMAASQIDLAEIKVSLAGPIVEMIYSGEVEPIEVVAEFAGDWLRAVTLASQRKSTPQAALGLIRQAESSVQQFFEREHPWAAVSAVADELLAHETLEHEVVEEIVAFWLRRD